MNEMKGKTCWAVTDKGRLDYLHREILSSHYMQDDPESGVIGEATQLHRETRQLGDNTGDNTKAYELVLQKGRNIMGMLGYRHGMGIRPGFDKDYGTTQSFDIVNSDGNPEAALNRVLRDLRKHDNKKC